MSGIKFSGVERLPRAQMSARAQMSPGAQMSKVAGRVDEPAGEGAERSERAHRALIIAAFGAVYLIWGSTYLGIKYAIVTLPPFLMGGGRFLMAGAVLTIWALVSERERPTRAHWVSAALIGGLLFLGGNGGVVWAEQYIASGLTALLIATEPLWVVLINWVRPGGTSPSGKTTIGLFIGFAGIWLLTGSTGLVGSGRTSIWGAVVIIAAAFSWALGSVYTQRAQLPASHLLASGMQMIMGGGLLTLAGTFSGEWTRLASSNVSALSIGAFFYLIIFGSIIAFTAYSWLLRTVSTTRAATYAYVNPIVAIILGWAIGGEALTIRVMLAAGVIVGSVVLINYGSQKRAEGSCGD